MSWKYVDIERINHPEVQSILDFDTDEIVIEEKVDGGNGCFFLEDGKLHICSRNRVLTKEEENVKTFPKSRKFIEETVHDLNPDFYYYFEHMQKHTINYGNGIIPAIGLDIKPKEGAFGKSPLFLGRAAKEKEFERIGLNCVKAKWVGTAKECRDLDVDVFTMKSEYYDGIAEGVVIKNYGRMNDWGKQLFAKVVREDFKEVNRAKFGGLKTDTSDTIKLVEAYVTDARIKKRVLALVNENNYALDRSLMKYLVNAVIEDVFKEETRGILKSFSVIHVGALKQKVAKECLRVLDEMIYSKKLNEPQEDTQNKTASEPRVMIFTNGDPFEKASWATRTIFRGSGLQEDVCSHGVGHPNLEWLKFHPRQKALGIHGCDGCCHPKVN